MTVRVWCPRCGQGWVARFRLGAASPRWVCDECDGVWRGDEVVPIPEADLSDELESLGLPPLWSSLTPSGEVLVDPRQGGGADECS